MSLYDIVLQVGDDSSDSDIADKLVREEIHVNYGNAFQPLPSF